MSNIKDILKKAYCSGVKTSHEQDCYASEEIRKLLTPEGYKIKDGVCMLASVMVCMNFLGLEFKKHPFFPEPGSSRFKDFGDNAAKLFGLQVYQGYLEDIEIKNGETYSNYRDRISQKILAKISPNSCALLAINSGSHWIATLNFLNRIWFIDSLQGYGFNLYQEKITINDIIKTEDMWRGAVPIFIPEKYFITEAHANWWANPTSINECEITKR